MLGKITALLSSMVIIFVSVFGVAPPKKNSGEETVTPSEKPEACTVGAYDAENADFTLDIDASDKLHEISDLLFGIFFEDINFAADGGLYAEMVQNRSFEFTELAAGNEKHAWNDVGDITAEVVKDDKTGCLNINNPNYIVITNASGEKGGIANTGFLDGMAVKEGEEYTLSFYAKSDSYKGNIYAQILVDDKVSASVTVPEITDEWNEYSYTLIADDTATDGVSLAILIDDGCVCLDMVSLIPVDTVNGLRKDLVESLAQLQPKFLRFPGGCVIEGHSLELAYDWKNSIGVDENGDPLIFRGEYGNVAARKMGQNIWTNEYVTDDMYPSYMTYGLGFYEYFLLAESIGAVGVPVINCGICCMGRGEETEYTQVGSQEQAYYIQNMLDLVEFCRGDETTKWGNVRIEMGHKEPFELRYIGIGNEQYGEAFYKHYESFVDAFIEAKEKSPELYEGLELIYSSGVDDGAGGNPDYLKSYTNAENWLKTDPDRSLSDFAGATDQHYYNAPGWFLTHTDYYDEENYSRDKTDLDKTVYGGGIPAFVGEYAALSNTWKAGLSEAAYMTGIERNGDIVAMAAYAPLFGNLTSRHWAPNLIWFNNHTVTKSVDYYVQQVFSINQGKYVLNHTLKENGKEETPDLKGKIGVGTWRTRAVFDNVLIRDNDTGAILGADFFERPYIGSAWEKVSDGKWMSVGGMLMQTSKATDIDLYNNTGTMMYYGDTDWSNYTFTVNATKTNGHEGFLLSFAVGDKDNNYIWNIGGWWNTKSALQKVEAGSKSAELPGTEKNIEIKKGKPYCLKVKVSGRNIKCYIDGELYIDYDAPVSTLSDVYSVVSTDDTGDTIIKLVNVSQQVQTVAINIEGMSSVDPEAVIYEVNGTSLQDDNYLGMPEAVTMTTGKLTGIASAFNYTVPAYSVTVIRAAEHK